MVSGTFEGRGPTEAFLWLHVEDACDRTRGTDECVVGLAPGTLAAMHRSRLAGFIIDCKNADLAEAGRFWSKALGMP
jgi:hypothetical protein